MEQDSESKALSAYFADMASVVTLSAKEERTVLRGFQRERKESDGPIPCGPNTSLLVSCHMPLVLAIAKKVHAKNRDHVALGDLICAGHLGILRALEDFDVSAGNRFGTYAAWWVRNKMSEEIRNELWPMRIPHHVYKDVLRYKKSVGVMILDGQSEPSRKEIAARLGWNMGRVNRAATWSNRDVLSMEMPVGERKQQKLADFIPLEEGVRPGVEPPAPPDESVGHLQMKKALREAVGTLAPREQRVIALRWGLDDVPRTFSEVGREMNISGERVRQIQSEALEKLRRPALSKELKDFLD